MTTADRLRPARRTASARGDRVVVKRWHDPEHHHRCPRYVRGAVGVVETAWGEEPVPGRRGRRRVGADVHRDVRRRGAVGRVAGGRAVHGGAWTCASTTWRRRRERRRPRPTTTTATITVTPTTTSPRSRRARSEFEIRAMALEAALVEAGRTSTDAIDAFVEHMEHRMGPHHGARVVARAWTDPAFKERLLADGTAAMAELGIAGAEGDNVRVVENTDGVHNLVVCTLCSCYPWPLLGVPPIWYK